MDQPTTLAVAHHGVQAPEQYCTKVCNPMDMVSFSKCPLGWWGPTKWHLGPTGSNTCLSSTKRNGAQIFIQK